MGEEATAIFNLILKMRKLRPKVSQLKIAGVRIQA